MNNLFKALNDATRREILELLKDGDMTAGDIADRFDMSKPSISHHLDLLRQADLVASVKKGQFVLYSLNMTVMDDIMAWFMQFKPLASAEKPRIRLQVSNMNKEN
jgi:ArsR family transcriptional regulator, arsenate/arsenite/antimonite-responsive transcriptional repressor